MAPLEGFDSRQEGLDDDPEPWPDGLGEPGDFQLHPACPSCGCTGASTAVRFVPVWDNGDGILTTEEVAEVLDRAMLRVEELASIRPAEVPLFSEATPDDVVMRLEGRRDGTFRAVILRYGGSDERPGYYPEMRLSKQVGAASWRHGLAMSRHTTEVTTDEDLAAGVRVYEGDEGVLNFTKATPWRPLPERAEELRDRRGSRKKALRGPLPVSTYRDGGIRQRTGGPLLPSGRPADDEAEG